MRNPNRFLNAHKNPRTLLEKASDFAYNLQDHTENEKSIKLDMLINIKFNLNTFNIFSNFSQYEEHIEYLLEKLEHEEIDPKILKAYNLEHMRRFDFMKMLREIKESTQYFQFDNRLKSFEAYIMYYFDKSYFSRNSNLHEIVSKFHDGSLLNEYYSEKNIDYKDFKEDNIDLHALLALFTMSVIEFRAENPKRIDLIAAAYKLFNKETLRTPYLDETFLNWLLKLVNDFADYLKLDPTTKSQIKEASKLCDLMISHIDDAEREMAFLSELFVFTNKLIYQ